MSPKKKRARHRAPDQTEWIESFHEALCFLEDEVLPQGRSAYMADEMLQHAAFGAFERIRTAAGRFDAKTRQQMPEVAQQSIADVRNLALYEYPLRSARYVWQTLENQAPVWRAGIDRARGQTRDGQPLTPLPTRADGTFAAVQAATNPLCGTPVKSNRNAPCILTRGHGGNHRSR